MQSIDHEPTKGMTLRAIFGVLGPLAVMMGAVIWGLGNLTIRDHQKYAEMANNTHFTNRTITAGRGAIYDTNGTPLAWSATVYKVYMDPTLFRQEMDEIDEIMKKRQAALDAGEVFDKDVIIKPRAKIEDEIVKLLSEKLHISEDTVLTAMEKDTQYYVLQTQVEKTEADEIMSYFESLGMNSITTQQDSKRYYPQNELAASVIGFTNGQGDGQYGLEAYYDDYLAGVNGRTTSAKDAVGNEMPYRYTTTYEAQDGSSLYLTIDTTLQYLLEKNLEAMTKKWNVTNRSCGIIMNAKTGAVYAMATYPSFDLNDPSLIYDEATRNALEALPEEEYEEAYVTAREQQWKNKAITELYVPGSVFKIFTAAAAIEEKTVDWENDTFYCSGAYTIQGADPIHCHNRYGHGSQSFGKALVNSCNPAFIEIGTSLGIHKFSVYFTAFGLREKTGIDLPGEAKSISFEEANMSFVDLASASFGQGNMVTPIEMITGFSAAINGGYLVEPHVVNRIVSSDNNVLKTFGTNAKRQVVSEETSAVMRKLLQDVVDDNTGGNAHIDGYKICGKSGTSQKYIDGHVSEDHNVASYACFAPADDPEFVMLIMADDPQGGNYYGSVVVAPYARAIMEEALPYLGYYPEYTEEQFKHLDVSVPLLMGEQLSVAQNALDTLGLNYEVKGEGEYVVGQCPITGTNVSAGGTVVLYTEEGYAAEQVEVPDLIGYSADEANTLLTNLGLNYVAIGASSSRSDARVSEQSIEPGTMEDVGTVIRLTYRVDGQSD
ncbi:MAG: PASTA domain-containing protein [Oscillospiraceae bacterium]|nr:PASTA domain-containing protein [Oscillospiraceae bacterium]